MLSDAKIVLCFALMTVSFAAIGWALITQNNCYDGALVSGQCSLVPKYVEIGLSYAGFYAGFFLMFSRFIKPSWKSQPRKWSVMFLSTFLGIVGGVALSEAGYYAARATGLFAVDYSTCGGYSTPPGCFIYNPFVQDWFIITGGTVGAVAGIILALRLRISSQRLEA